MALGIALPVIDLRRLPLKLRVALACTGLGLVLSVLFSASTIFITERFESVIVKKLLESDGWDAGSGPRGNVERGSHGAPAASPLIRYVAKGGDRSRVPSELRDLPIGLQEFEDSAGNDRAVSIYDVGSERRYLTIDLGKVDQLEDLLNEVLAAIVLFGALVSGSLGWWWAGHSVLPLTRLAAAVDGLPPQPVASELASAYGQDEVGRLAAAIDKYQSRLVAAKSNEIAFFAEASHELRTPMAVLCGVVDVMIDSDCPEAERRRRLRRLERGVSELVDKTDAMFVLARGRFDPPESVDVASLLRECIDDYQMHLPDSATIRIQAGASPPVLLYRRQAQLVFRALMRDAVVAEDPGVLDIQYAYPQVRICFTASPEIKGPDVPGPQPYDLRLETALVGRLAMAMGWSIEGSIAGPDKCYCVGLAPGDRRF